MNFFRRKTNEVSKPTVKAEQPTPAVDWSYHEDVDLESFSWSRIVDLITANTTYIEGALFPSKGNVVQFTFLGQTVAGLVTFSEIMTLRDGTREVHIQAQRIR